MVSKFIIYTLSVLAVCSFCGEDFISLGRHTWRCKRKLHQGASQNHVTYGNSYLPQDLFILNNNMSDNNDPANTEEIKCACGKKCKGLPRLKAHQRSCRTIKTLCNEVLDDLNSNNRTDQQEEITIDKKYCQRTCKSEDRNKPSEKRQGLGNSKFFLSSRAFN